MEKVYVLENLSCPHCAAAIEKKVSGMGGVKTARVDVVTRRLTVEHEEALTEEDLGEGVRREVRSVEPGIAVRELREQQEREEESGEEDARGDLLRLVLGAAVYAAGLLTAALHAPHLAVLAVFTANLLVSGGRVFLSALRNIPRGEVFDENLLMSIAGIAAFAIGLYEEAAAVMLFNQVGEFFQDLATRRSRRSIADLMDLRPDYANLKTAEGVSRVSPQEVIPGQLIEVRPGERLPLDGTVEEGSSLVDTSALTGEPVPREVGPGDEVAGGYVNGGGLLTVRVGRAYGDSTVARIVEMVENAGSKKAKAEAFITKFARVYTPSVGAAALLLAVLPPLITGQSFGTWIVRAVVFLVVSCPCALVVSVPLGFFAGIGAASRRGVLVKGGNYLEMLAKLDTVVFDKTGTLTQGVFEVSQLLPAPGVAERELLEAAAAAESRSGHPAALSIRRAAGGTEAESSDVAEYEEIAGMGVAATVDGRHLLAGSDRLLAREGVAFQPGTAAGTLVYVARDKRFLGCIVIADRLREDAAAAVQGLRRCGVRHTAMLTGDSDSAARAAAESTGVDEVRARLLPDGKVEAYEEIAAKAGGVCAFLGDGINDAPVLARADVGIAMGGVGSDAAVEAADVVLMDDKPSRLVDALGIARLVRRLVSENIVFALGVKFAVLLLGAVGYANIWAAVFADTGVALLAVLNSMRALRYRGAAPSRSGTAKAET